MRSDLSEAEFCCTADQNSNGRRMAAVAPIADSVDQAQTEDELPLGLCSYASLDPARVPSSLCPSRPRDGMRGAGREGGLDATGDTFGFKPSREGALLGLGPCLGFFRSCDLITLPYTRGLSSANLESHGATACMF